MTNISCALSEQSALVLTVPISALVETWKRVPKWYLWFLYYLLSEEKHMISKINLKSINFYNRKCFILLRVFLIFHLWKFCYVNNIYIYNIYKWRKTHEIFLRINEVYGNLFTNFDAESIIFNQVHDSCYHISNFICIVLKQYLYSCKCVSILPPANYYNFLIH